MTQSILRDAIGVSLQLMQKYEYGAYRISASRLFDLSRLLDVPVQFFFDDMPTAVAAVSPANKKRGRAKKLPSYEPDPRHKRETLELVRAYYKIPDPQIRKRLYEMVKAIGAGASKNS